MVTGANKFVNALEIHMQQSLSIQNGKAWSVGLSANNDCLISSEKRIWHPSTHCVTPHNK
ncbi:hypothetical protein YC2023_090876 [Brassica napus]